MTERSVMHVLSCHSSLMTSSTHSPLPTRFPGLMLLVAISLLLHGCIKYTPSREELEKDRSDGSSISAHLGSEEEFNAYERALTDRLQRLISDRSYLLTASQSINGYAVGPGDIISVDVYGFGDLRTETEVSPSGTLSLPLVGETDVKGRDISSLKKHLSGLYSRYVRNPRIDVSIKTYHSNRVSVIGEVQRPGMYPLRRNGQLITELISEAGGKNQLASNRIILLPAPTLEYVAQTAHPATAGGFTYSANVKHVEVIRDIGGGRKALATLDLEEVGLRGGRDIRLRAGDLVRVPSEPGRFFQRQVVEALNSLFNGVSVNRPVN